MEELNNPSGEFLIDIVRGYQLKEKKPKNPLDDVHNYYLPEAMVAKAREYVTGPGIADVKTPFRGYNLR